MQLLGLVRGQVRVGSPLPFGVRDEQGQLLLAAGHVVTSEAQLAALLERGATVDIEEVRAALQRSEASRQPQRSANLFEQWEQMLWQLDRLLRSTSEPGFAGRIDAFVHQLVALTRRDRDIAVYLAMRQDPKRLSIYALAHAIHCAKVGLLMGERLGLDDAHMAGLLKAALTMNIATLDLQGRLATQGIAPTEVQRAEIRSHPARSVQLLREAGVDDERWLAAVAGHHERPDGSGYPAGTHEVGELATMLRRLDVFLAKMAPRALRDPLPVQQAERELFAEDQGGPVSSAIIKEFGLYPPGEMVQLKSGELAVVVRRGASARTPVAAAITDRKGLPTVNTTLRDTARADWAITGLAPDRRYVLRVPPERLYGLPV